MKVSKYPEKGPFDSGSLTEGVVATGAGSTPGRGAGSPNGADAGLRDLASLNHLSCDDAERGQSGQQGGEASTVTFCDTPGSRASGATHRNPAAHGRAPQQIWILMGRDSSPSSWLSNWLISAHSNEQDADEAKTLWLRNVGRRFDAYVIAVELS